MAKKRTASDKKLDNELKRLRSQIALVLKDEELLDSLFKRLRLKTAFCAKTYTKTHADGDLGAAQEATDRAMEKVFQFVAQLDSESAKHILDVDNYLAKMAHNEVREHFRGRRQITLDHQTVKTAYTDELLWDDDTRGGSGAIVFALPNEKRGRRRKKTITFVDRLLQYFYTPSGIESVSRLKKGWLSKVAKQAKLLVDTMPDDGTAKKILRGYLLGYKQVDIAGQWGLQKSNVSRTLKTWLDDWGWDENKQREVRLGFLFHNLADIASESKGLYPSVTTDHRTAAWRSFLEKDDETEPGWYIGSLEQFARILWSSGWGWNNVEQVYTSLEQEDDSDWLEYDDTEWPDYGDDTDYDSISHSIHELF